MTGWLAHRRAGIGRPQPPRRTTGEPRPAERWDARARRVASEVARRPAMRGRHVEHGSSYESAAVQDLDVDPALSVLSDDAGEGEGDSESLYLDATEEWEVCTAFSRAHGEAGAEDRHEHDGCRERGCPRRFCPVVRRIDTHATRRFGEGAVAQNGARRRSGMMPPALAQSRWLRPWCHRHRARGSRRWTGRTRRRVPASPRRRRRPRGAEHRRAGRGGAGGATRQRRAARHIRKADDNRSSVVGHGLQSGVPAGGRRGRPPRIPIGSRAARVDRRTSWARASSSSGRVAHTKHIIFAAVRATARHLRARAARAGGAIPETHAGLFVPGMLDRWAAGRERAVRLPASRSFGARLRRQQSVPWLARPMALADLATLKLVGCVARPAQVPRALRECVGDSEGSRRVP